MIHEFLRSLSDFKKTIDKAVYYPQTHTAIIYLRKYDDMEKIVERAKQYNLHVSIQINESKKKKMIVVRELEVH